MLSKIFATNAILLMVLYIPVMEHIIHKHKQTVAEGTIAGFYLLNIISFIVTALLIIWL